MRLINADKLKDILTSNSGSALENALIGIINAQHTAYDVDKVVEQLEELRTPPENILYPFIWEEAVEQAIEIVKAGGVNE